MKKYSILNTIILIAALIGSYLALIYLSDKYILTNDFYDRNGQPLSGIPELETMVFHTVQNIVYFYSAVYLIVKLLAISLVIYTGLYAFGTRIAFRDILRVVSVADFIFLLPALIKIWWFYYEAPAPTLVQWENFYVFSLASFSEYIRPVFLYPLQSLNAFEVAYWFLLAAGIRSLTGFDFDRSLRVVLVSYLPAFLLWVMLVTFFTILFFPQSY